MLALALSRRTTAVVVLAASLGVLAWLWFGESDEDRITASLRRLAAELGTREGESVVFRSARLRRVFDETLEPEVTFEAPELQATRGARELAELAAAAPRFYGSFEVTMDELDVEVGQGARAARVVSRAALSGSRGGELRRDVRSVEFRLLKRGDDWRVADIRVAAATHEEPEARP